MPPTAPFDPTATTGDNPAANAAAASTPPPATDTQIKAESGTRVKVGAGI